MEAAALAMWGAARGAVEDFWVWFSLLLSGGGLLMTVVLPLCLCGTLLGVAAMVGVGLDQCFFRPARQAKRAAQAWPTTTGVVLDSFVETATSYDSTSNAETTSFTPRVTYEYEVNGQRYRSDRLKTSDGFFRAGLLPGSAEAVVARYPAGAQVFVYYNPANPHEAVLER